MKIERVQALPPAKYRIHDARGADLQSLVIFAENYGIELREDSDEVIVAAGLTEIQADAFDLKFAKYF